MRICLATRRFPVVTETFVGDSAAALRLDGHDVSIVARRRGSHETAPSPAWTPVIAGGFSTWPSRVRRMALHPAAWAGACMMARRRVGSTFASSCRAVHLAGLEAVVHCDCILAHFGYVGVDWLPVAVLAQRRLAVYFHGSDITRWLRRDPRMYEGLFASAAGLLTNSEFLKARLIAAGADPRRTRVVPLSAHASFAALSVPPSEERRRMITIARLVEKKGLDDAIAAFAAACRTIAPDWRYLIVGDGPQRSRLRRIARQAGVEDRVKFVARAGREQVRRALVESSMYIQSSRTASNGDTEGTPVSLLEAAASGLPVIATAHGGIPELLPAQATTLGWVVPERDIRGLTDAMVTLASDAGARREWGRACRDFVRERTPDREARDLAGALQDVGEVPA